MQTFTLIFSSIFIILTLLPLIRSGKWWIRIFDYPRIQIASCLSLAVFLTLINFDFESNVTRVLLVLLIGCIAHQLSLIFKYTSIYYVQAKKARNPVDRNTITLLESNIRMQNREAHRLISLVEKQDPDVVVVNEADKWWAAQLSKLDDTYPYSLKKPLENTYGMLLFSKFPLQNTEINFLVEEDIPSFYATIVLPSTTQIDLHCLHPKPPMPGTPTYERDTEILLIGKRIREADRPAIVVGDLNDVAWSYTNALFQRYSGLLDPRQGRGLFNTYNVFLPLFRYPLDHFFYSEHFGLKRLERLEAIGSDHFPMLLEVCYEPEKQYEHKKPVADKEEEKEAEEKIKEGFE